GGSAAQEAVIQGKARARAADGDDPRARARTAAAAGEDCRRRLLQGAQGRHRQDAGPCRRGARRAPGLDGTLGRSRFPRYNQKLMISVSGVSMRFGSKILVEDVATTFSAGRRYGLTGPNGAGKSTFMKLLTGESDPQRGTVVRPKKIGALRQ